jgi:hypothetical protein
MILYVFLFIGKNADVFSNNSTIGWIGMALGVLVLYGLGFGVLNNITNLELGYSGFKLSTLFFGLLIPLAIFIYNFSFNEPETKYSSLLEKENITLISNNKACSKIKYGSFTNGSDTIVRYSENNFDYELIKTLDQQFKNRIKWLDSCSYVRIENNNSVSRYIRFGNFENDFHYMYGKPASVHNINNETYEMILEID